WRSWRNNAEIMEDMEDCVFRNRLVWGVPMISGIVIREVTAADAGAWIAMRAALWPDESGETHSSEVTRLLANPPRGVGAMPEAVLVAVDENAVPPRAVGFVELSRRLHAEGCNTSPVGFLEGWYVVPDYRRRGIGGALVAASETWARALGCREFASDALVENVVSQAAHKALGFEEVEVIRCFRKSL